MRAGRGRLLLAGVGLIAAGIPLAALAGGWGRDYGSNGERIYFTGANALGEAIAFSGAAFVGGRAGSLSCASCHGADAEGGRHRMHMLVMDARDIRWLTLAGAEGAGDDHEDEHAGYDLAAFRRAVVDGRHPDGASLSDLMPRWQLSDADLADLADYLRTLD